jgi:hypothetical protein
VKVFVSYSSVDRPLVAAIVADLEAAGYEVWFDQELSGGQAWWDVILDKVRSSDVIVFAVTDAAVASHACRAEAAYAAALGKTVIPLRLTDVAPDAAPSALQQVQWIDYRNPDRASAFALVRSVNNATTRPLPDPLPDPPPVPLSYLADLVDKVDTPSVLTLENQLAIVFAFRQLVAQERDPTKLIDLLARFRQRDDLLAKVAVDIDMLIAQLTPAAPSVSPTPKAAPPPRRPPRSPDSPVAAPTPGGRERPNRTPLWIALGALAAVVLAGIVVVATRGDDTKGGASTTTTSAPTTTPVGEIQYACKGGLALCIRIDSVTVENDFFVVSWTAINFQPDTSGNHAHFFWDTTRVAEAGTNAAAFGYTPGKWELTSAQPFRSTADFLRPSAEPIAAKHLCATVGDHDHAVVDPANYSCFPWQS